MSASENITISTSTAFELSSDSHPSQNTKKSKTEIRAVKQKAISLLTTAYKTDSDEQVEELEAKLKDLLQMIRPEDVPPRTHSESATTTSEHTRNKTSSPIIPSLLISKVPPPPPTGVLLRDFNGGNPWNQAQSTPPPVPIEARIGEIKKPLKQFRAQTTKDEILLNQKGMVAGIQQEAYLEAAMGRKQSDFIGYIFSKTNVSETESLNEVGKNGEMQNRRKKSSHRKGKKTNIGNSKAAGIFDGFAGMIVTTENKKRTKSSSASISSTSSFDSEDDVSTLGTESTYESMPERMTGFLRVRRLPTTAEEEPSDESPEEDGENRQESEPQDIAEEEAATEPSWGWGWFQPREQLQATGAQS